MLLKFKDVLKRYVKEGKGDWLVTDSGKFENDGKGVIKTVKETLKHYRKNFSTEISTEQLSENEYKIESQRTPRGDFWIAKIYDSIDIKRQANNVKPTNAVQVDV